MNTHLVLNGLIPFLDLPLEAQDVLLQGLNDSLQLHLLCLQGVDVVGALFNLLLQAVELKIQIATTRTPKALLSSPFRPTLRRFKELRMWGRQECPRPNGRGSVCGYDPVPPLP